ncbi:MAG: DNA polymerase III subunit gamma/tau [Acetobacter aceti]|uniref:DNA polymerase III subunit gamma/tau n=1 Tax=Acetobacter aceti TaxID=435 RepID=A0A1U9KGX2_ACEAC|nr:DNA polymerase III subunit gamma/tau [Acetobacter aceti]AQS85051.1 DNA polymerase III subunit gamma/tau [Acetobacter aceti]
MPDTDTEAEDDLPLPPGDGMGLFFGDAPTEVSVPQASTPSNVATVLGSDILEASPEESPKPAVAYRVLARKYRPATLDQLIGQDALVRTLRNAFAVGRVAHAFMLTGVRGVGKTTTARIIARGLNCVGPDGKGGATADPCGVCPNCVAILADRHPDVLEMDAASRTGVDDVREIIEACHFRPIQGRMKVFIIDEVHMLSRNAFNALLKTLEEPPPQVTFIFATTELRKVPITVLSRCQRFDLRRVSQSELLSFFTGIVEKEHVSAEQEALKLIARAADGSVRDGLSLLDQAIAQGAGTQGASDGSVTESGVAAMLGLSDRAAIFDLFDCLMRGDVTEAIRLSDSMYDRGNDPGLMLRDLAELTHTVTRLKTVKGLEDTLELPEMERTRGAAFAGSLSLSTLSRLWQMLLKGISEVDDAPLRREAAEMVLIRLCHAATMPPPEELLKKLRSGEVVKGAAPVNRVADDGRDSPRSMMPSPDDGSRRQRVANERWGDTGEGPSEPIPLARAAAPSGPQPPRSWRELVAFVKDSREATLHGHLRHSTHLVTFAPPLVEVRIDSPAPPDLVKRLQEMLRASFGNEWVVRPVEAQGEPTLAEQSAEIIQLHNRRSSNHPLVQAILNVFPDAELGDVRDHTLDDHYGLPPEDFGSLETEPLAIGLDPELDAPEEQD